MPVADAMAREGTRSGWSLNTIVYPGATDVKFNAVTVDVIQHGIPSSTLTRVSTTGGGRSIRYELGTTFEQYDKLRHQGDVDIFAVQDTITSNK